MITLTEKEAGMIRRHLYSHLGVLDYPRRADAREVAKAVRKLGQPCHVVPGPPGKWVVRLTS